MVGSGPRSHPARLRASGAGRLCPALLGAAPAETILLRPERHRLWQQGPSVARRRGMQLNRCSTMCAYQHLDKPTAIAEARCLVLECGESVVRVSDAAFPQLGEAES